MTRDYKDPTGTKTIGVDKRGLLTVFSPHAYMNGGWVT
jgi:hypothetical protein